MSMKKRGRWMDRPVEEVKKVGERERRERERGREEIEIEPHSVSVSLRLLSIQSSSSESWPGHISCDDGQMMMMMMYSEKESTRNMIGRGRRGTSRVGNDRVRVKKVNEGEKERKIVVSL